MSFLVLGACTSKEETAAPSESVTPTSGEAAPADPTMGSAPTEPAGEVAAPAEEVAPAKATKKTTKKTATKKTAKKSTKK